MLAAKPDTVRMDKAPKATPATVAMAREFKWLGAYRPAGFAWMTQDLHPSGAVGDATLATAGKGEAALRRGARGVRRTAARDRPLRSGAPARRAARLTNSPSPTKVGEGDRAFARWKGRGPRRSFCNDNEASSQRPPPPCFAWSPSPASRGRISNPVLAARLRVRALPKLRQRISPNVSGDGAPGGAKVVAAPRGRMLPLARASGAARATGRSACANRLLRARGASRRSTAVSLPRRPARLGLKTALAPSVGLSLPTASFRARFEFAANVTKRETIVKQHIQY